MSAKRNYTEEELKGLRKRHAIYRIVIIGMMVVALIIVFNIKSCQRHRRQLEEMRSVLIEDSIRRMHQAEKRAREWAIQEEERKRRLESVEVMPTMEPPKSEPPKYSWSHLETMVRDLSNEGYFASIWKVDDDTSAWMVIYQKGGRHYIRKFNPETDTYGKPTLLRYYETGKYHVWGDKSRWYNYNDGGQLIYEVNGVEKARYINPRTIDLFTPEPVPDGYEDWEDYYYDNEEDLREYYGL